MKLATVVVLYHPDVSVADNIASYAQLSDFLYVWDNTPGRSSEAFYAELNNRKEVANHPSVKYLHCEQKNMGLAYAYNRAIEEAEKAGATHLMTMDQDSRFERFEIFLEKIAHNEDGKIGVFAPPIDTEYDHDVQVTNAAQSGCVFVMAMIRQIGMFREDFFIGMVDAEMLLKAACAGYKIVQIAGCHLSHHVGSERTVSFLGKTIQVSDYGPQRHYYDSRNRILMWREFPGDYNWKGKLGHYWGRLKVMAKILLFEKNKWKKIFAIVRGTWNGLFNRVRPY